MFEELDLLLPEDAFDGPMQMALDEVLLKQVSLPTLRIYRWVSSCISFGYFQKLAEVRNTHPSLPLVRRWTGGGIVEHANKLTADLTFSLMIPRGNGAAKLAPALFYSNLHGALAEGLTRLTQEKIRLAGDQEILSGPSCFSAPARDDLLCQGRKILGGAQRRSAGSLLYQGSLQRVEMSEGSLLGDLLADSLSEQITTTILKQAIQADAVALAESRYSSEAWNARR